MKRMKEMAPTKAVGCTLAGSWEAKTEIPDEKGGDVWKPMLAEIGESRGILLLFDLALGCRASVPDHSNSYHIKADTVGVEVDLVKRRLHGALLSLNS